MVFGMLVYPRANMNLSYKRACRSRVELRGSKRVPTNWWLATLATVAPLHLCCQFSSHFSHDGKGKPFAFLNIWDVLSKWKCPLISLQNPKIISRRLMYSNFIIFGVREWQQDFWPIAYNIAIFSVYSTSCVSPPAELNFACGWSSYTWSGQLLRLK